ncbi:methyltransferase type 11 [Propionigenium maris DSM 9537]|uniref:Methyltransferase type 11 n=1 Tax=Propionigenium maris DSM 9537 TaxID=1123000 RepID=A0A9W6GM74_9FUSO|nr:class I SAM-dependent methyltransferase [Propionigenium maris]GLI56505.1 methyltransferase type 11 [Propionigenium maris DSM 9537]
MENIFKVHRDMPRQGPGDNESTRRALDLTGLSGKSLKVLDIGCGPGMQTVELAKSIEGRITALDFHKKYLEELSGSAEREGIGERIETLEGSMFELEKYFKREEFDLIWSEGAIYIMGFERGLKDVKPFLKSGGYLAVTEITWLEDNPPKEIREFWDTNYPQMGTVKSNEDIAIENGYEVIDTFILPENSWWENYYNPLKERCEFFKREEPTNSDLMEFIKETELEMELFKKYSSSYNYVFYVMKKSN